MAFSSNLLIFDFFFFFFFLLFEILYFPDEIKNQKVLLFLCFFFFLIYFCKIIKSKSKNFNFLKKLKIKKFDEKAINKSSLLFKFS